MKSMYEIQQLLRRFGIFIYTGNRLGDLELMEMELKELYEMNFITLNDYQIARLTIKKEVSDINRKNKGGGRDGKNDSWN